TPLIQQETLERMFEFVEKKPEMVVAVLGMCPLDKQNYARLRLNDKGDLEEIIEDKDASPSQKELPLCNSGVMLVRGDFLHEALPALTPNNAAKEYYLTDLVKIARQKKYLCGVVEGEASEFIGINSRQDLALAETCLQKRFREKAMEKGVTLLDPQTIYFSYDTQVEQDVILHPHVVLGTGVTLEKGVEILSFCKLADSHVGPNVVVGPFAHLRGGVSLQEGAEIGNFVEIKKSTFGPKAKAKHLSYIGDAEVGPKANIGAGTITCNYDGLNKFKTEIGEGVFIGSNSSLIAPLSIGDYAIVGAGSVVTQSVEGRALAVARAPQTIFEGGADKFRDKRKLRKDT
ncbi:MAG: bifunctional UDP-N-acetylglucosamine diphosphorylase/glucosamine-1-phosphate N-acetyltransferase GlmU, partial [Alphaproteobacteria bacterium]|nr:bifunctional UDP-N-acetylglucosamine diphosphorylase/glucosamine-1-phosphate N-acetyltransferase GlmU [Alphaproteobacteria bacterium]